MGASGYVIVTPPAYAAAVAPLADWKRRKGLAVTVATTTQTGQTTTAIRNWLRNAYDTWAIPPAYVVLIGDVNDIPSWSFLQNVTDLPYALLDGDDWLPDVMVGRFSVASLLELETMVAKTIAYERTPYLASGDAWITRALLVAGNYGSETPVSTVTFCGQQLSALGFSTPLTVFWPPPFNWNGVTAITNALQTGVSQVVYRGWAYGTAGWEPPHFTVLDIPSVDNGAMTPVVMSFVCLNGDFAASVPCFGEVFTRQGTPTSFKGAVAFIGNGEHWSHTRYNDAMAISFFERITDPSVVDLGSLMTAGKLRFLDYFPLEWEADEWGEESCEFYFHIYNLLGDPELNFYKSVPRVTIASHPNTLAPGANYFEVSVAESDGVTPLAGAHVAAVQGDALLGWGRSDAAGIARLSTSPVIAGAVVDLTVNGPGLIPYEGTISTSPGGTFLAVTDCLVDDGGAPPSAGNADGQVNPGETLALRPTLRNSGEALALEVSGTLAVTGPASVLTGSAPWPNIVAGGFAVASAPFVATVAADAQDGARITGLVSAVHDGGLTDVSQTTLTVAAPRLLVTAAVDGDGYAEAGETVTLTLVLRNEGSAGTTGGTGMLTLLTPTTGEVLDGEISFGPLAAGSALLLTDTCAIRLAADVAAGTGLDFRLDIVTAEGYESAPAFALLAGRLDAGAPVGPDRYGYYAYDSADIDYPGQAPVFRWHELSPAYGGTGTEIVFQADGQVRTLALPFTFRYYGQDFNDIRVCDGGWISFDTDGFLDFYNWPLPSPHGNHSIVAPFWDNFNPMRPESDGIYYAYDAVAGTFTVEWSRQRHYQPEIDDLQTFQVVLFDPVVHPTPSGDGEILFLYKQVANSDYLRTYATVGIEDPTETDGLLLSYSNVYAAGAAPLSAGLAIAITTRSPVYDPLRLSAFTATGAPEGVQLQWTPADERALSGWRLVRWDGASTQVVGGRLLPAADRSFLDTAADPGADCVYQVFALHPSGAEIDLGRFAYTASARLPRQVVLEPCRPNPAPGATRLAYALPRATALSLRVYDLAGRHVRTLLAGVAAAGPGETIWDGRDDTGRMLPGGVYFVRLATGNEVLTRRVLLIR